MDSELFERAPIPKAYFSLAMPVVLSMLVTLVYNMVDTYFIAHTGDTNMVAGVSLTAPVFTVMIALGDIFGLGGSSVISRLFGQHRFADGKRLSVFCFYAAIMTGILIVVLGLVFRDQMLTVLGATSDTWVPASEFYTLIIIGSPFIIVSMTPTNMLRTEGHAVQSMIGSIAGTAINVVLNPLFIHVFGWGAAGSAGATVIANILTDAYFVWFLLKRSPNLSIDPRLMFRKGDAPRTTTEAMTADAMTADASTAHTRPTRGRLDITGAEIRDILVIGIPSAITNLTQSVGIVMMNLFLLPYGTDAVAAMGIALKVVMIAVLVFVGFAFGAQPLIGYNYGARNMVRLAGIMRFAYAFLCSFALVMTVVLSLFDRQLMRFFIADETIITLGAGILRVQLLSLVCVAIVMVTTCTFQSTGKALGAFLLSIGRQGVILAVTLFIGSRVAGYNGVIAAQALADLVTAILAVVLFVVMLPELRGSRGISSASSS
ncbi:multidrug transporter MatE [Bifidobacterium sp. UTCIF-37]|uniref:MATE family efflux transporter n=1 Tax=unclassified Bifidobacterium TaxID=2608897 RepID=UPI00112A1C9A|nr:MULTISPECIES: MATE family efflux transporter [unclassified Bifidobacterium]TPF86621.1 multidrug transporter MatE [Bifidobacterium sp. UTCIF-37]TPF90239.1 multidrug transporter MatE [Bifidobacterium sp. UTCIF-38]